MKESEDFDGALSSLLQEVAIDHEPDDKFVQATVRRARLDFHARTLQFWTPAILGAVVTALGLLAAIETVYFAPAKAPINRRGQEAKTVRTQPLIPEGIDPTGTSVVR